MRWVARALVLVCLFSAGCGDGDDGDEAASTQPRVTAVIEPTTIDVETQPNSNAAGTTNVRVYFIRDGRVATGARALPKTQAVARAALASLLDGPTHAERDAGMTSAVDANLELRSLEIRNGVAAVHFNLPLAPASAELAQIVYTLTQFSSIKRVSVVVETNDSMEFTRRDFEDLTPIILVESPTPGEEVTSPLRITGTANTFEANLQLELRDASNKVIAKKFTTATSGSGQRGTFDTTLAFPAQAGPGKLIAFEHSAANGKRIHEYEVPLLLR